MAYGTLIHLTTY